MLKKKYALLYLNPIDGVESVLRRYRTLRGALRAMDKSIVNLDAAQWRVSKIS